MRASAGVRLKLNLDKSPIRIFTVLNSREKKGRRRGSRRRRRKRRKKKEEEEDEDEEKETKTLKERYDRRGSSRRVNKKPNPGSGIYLLFRVETVKLRRWRAIPAL